MKVNQRADILFILLCFRQKLASFILAAVKL